MPLAFTQEDFLVIIVLRDEIFVKISVEYFLSSSMRVYVFGLVFEFLQSQ